MFIQTASWLATLAARKVGETARERVASWGCSCCRPPGWKLSEFPGRGVNLFTCHAFWATISTQKVARGERQRRESYRKEERGQRRGKVGVEAD